MSSRRDDYSEFTDAGIEVFAISINHPFSQKAFAESLQLPYALLSDYPDGKTTVAFGVDYREGEANQMFARPSFFLVDKKGVIRGYWGQRPPNPADEIFAPDPKLSSEPMLAMAAKIQSETQ